MFWQDRIIRKEHYRSDLISQGQLIGYIYRQYGVGQYVILWLAIYRGKEIGYFSTTEQAKSAVMNYKGL